MVSCSTTTEVTVALSGTLDTFALPDVLRLLGSTKKTGRLRITGDRGSGSVWVDNGQVVATELTALSSLEPTDIEVVFGLLRFSAGSFTFEADANSPNAGSPMSMDPILGAAENMLAEWHSIEEVVPSLDVWVGLSPELNGPDVMIDAARWQCIASIGTGAQVGLVAETLNLNEIDACRVVKELVELGLVHLIDEPARIAVSNPPPAPVAEILVDTLAEDEVDTEASEGPDATENGEIQDIGSETTFSPSHVEELPNEGESIDDSDSDADSGPAEETAASAGQPLAAVGDTSTVPSLASLPPSDQPSIDPLLPSGDPLDMIPAAQAVAPPVVDPQGGSDVDDDDGDDDDLNPAEMARQLANLSPKAAKAVAAAAKASTEAEREAALAEVEAEDDSVNRGLLLKFLGSVDS